MGRAERTGSVLLLVLLTAACAERERPVGENPTPARSETPAPDAVSVAELRQDLERYRQGQVAVSGRVEVELAFEFVDEQPYTLDDGTGRITVVTTGMVPEEGSWVTVRGCLRAPYQIKGRSYELALMEAAREP